MNTDKYFFLILFSFVVLLFAAVGCKHRNPFYVEPSPYFSDSAQAARLKDHEQFMRSMDTMLLDMKEQNRRLDTILQKVRKMKRK